MKRTVQIMVVMLTSFSLWAQEGVVTGKVTTTEGEGIPGVNVIVKGTSIGSITDTEGQYRISAQGGTLIFSFIGYSAQEVEINGRTVVDVVMQEDVTTLEQVVVIGYGTQKKKDITSSVAVVDQSAIENRPLVSPLEALQGKAAGVQVTQNSGKPGAPLSVRVRGSTSIEAGNEPLYVIDGVQTADTRGLNPSDIASISVLKDAASASIYGARAANGVVIITTKRGRTGTPTIRFDSYVGFSKLRKKIDVLNTDQYKALMAEIPSVGALDPSITNYTDWNKEVFRTGVAQNYQLSLSGGTEKSQYLISGSYLKNEGMVKPAQFDRYSIRLNLDNQVTSWFKVATNMNFLRLKTEDTPDNLSSGRGGVIMSTLNTPPFLNIYKPDGSGQFDPNPFQPSWENPYAYMNGTDQQQVESRLYGNVNTEIKFTKDLSLKSNLGIDLGFKTDDSYTDPFRTVAGRQAHGLGHAIRESYYSWIIENMLNYTKSFGNHNLNVIAGISSQKRQTDYSNISGSDFPEDTHVKTMNAANVESAYNTIDEWSLVSFLARVMYDYQGKYLFTGSIRRDGSSKLANPWGVMSSVSVGWRISSESFMEGVTAIDDLKLRLSYGRTGNQEGIPSYIKYGLTEYTRRPVTNPLPTGPSLSQKSLGNQDLKWETTDQANLGIDLSVLESRLNFTFDAYIKKTHDLLLDVQLPEATGMPSILTNAGEMQNKGIELNVSSVNMDKELKWVTDFNISFNRNKITSINEKLSSVYPYGRVYSNNQDVIFIRPGYALGTFYGYVSEGVNPETGDIQYKDVNKNGIVTPDDRTIIGYAQPDFIYGLTNTLTYKNWNLSFFFQGSQGNDVFNATRVDLEGMFDSKNQSTAVLRRWTETNKNTDIPRAGNINNVNNSTRFVEDGSYLRLKAITLGYDLSGDLLNRVGIRKLYVYGTGQNLLTFTNYSGFDPEVNAFGQSSKELGVDYGTYPQARTIIFGINVEF